MSPRIFKHLIGENAGESAPSFVTGIVEVDEDGQPKEELAAVISTTDPAKEQKLAELLGDRATLVALKYNGRFSSRDGQVEVQYIELDPWIE